MNAPEKLSMEALNRVDAETYAGIEKIPLKIILDDVRSMHNVGAVFRTADAFRVEEIVLCGITPAPPHREIHKAALGAEDTVAWTHEKDVLAAAERVKKEGYTLVGIEQTIASVPLSDFGFQHKKYALVFGNEVFGVNDEVLKRCDAYIEIPQEGTKHSLNISVCAGIVMWEFFKEMR